MFEGSNVFIILREDNQDVIKKLNVLETTRSNICKLFSDVYERYRNADTKVDYNGEYKPNQGEVLVVSGFIISDNYLSKVENTVIVDDYIPQNNADNEYAEIKGIFLICNNNEVPIFAFQRFRSEQYIIKKGLPIFYANNTFKYDERFGFSIYKTIDCVYCNNELTFFSEYFAKQLFDLTDYFHEATYQEVEDFIRDDNLKVNNTENFHRIADQWTRRKIKSIKNSGVLEHFSTDQILEKANTIDFELVIENDSIVIPKVKKEMKSVLKFLDEEIYQGMFTQHIFEVSSKKLR